MVVIDTELEKYSQKKKGSKEMANGNGNGNALSSLISKKFMTVGGGVLSFYLVMNNCQAFFDAHPNAVYVAFPCMTIILGLYIYTQGKVDEWKLINGKDNGTE